MKKIIYRILILIMILSQFSQIVFAQDYAGHWAENTIKIWFNKGLVTGDGNGNFMPDEPISRAEFLTLVMKSINAQVSVQPSKFADIYISDWYYSTVAAAENMGIVTGSENSEFRPNDNITRQDAMTILGRAYKIKGGAVFNISDYPDGVEIAEYALPYMAYMCENNVLKGYDDGMIRPERIITRAEALVIADRMNLLMNEPDRVKKIEFEKGYPKLRDGGLAKGFNVSLRTNKKCTVYYTIVPINQSITNKNLIDKMLITIDEPDTDVSAYISYDTDEECNIYFKAVDEYGNESKIANIRNAKTLYFTEGDGSRENPYMVSTEEQLDAMRYYLNKHFKLKNDIIISGKWTPIGTGDGQENMFSGSLDGNGYKISNLQVSNVSENAGLFGYIYTGEVRNLYVSAQRITGKNNVGVIAGTVDGGTVENCFTDGLVRASSNYAGGIVGTNNGKITRCQSAVPAIEAQSYAGGMAGWNSGDITECMSCTYSVLANMYSSGIAGMNVGKVSGCVAANINVTDYMTDNNGRIATSKEKGIVENNYAYNKMNANVGNWLPDKDSPNGLDVSWEQLNDAVFYTTVVGWNFGNYWRTAENGDSFRLPSLKKLSLPKIEEGVTLYAPKQIYTAEELAKISDAPDNNYILMNDISLPLNEDGGNWDVICSGTEISDNRQTGFSGSLDGNGHTIYNLDLEYSDKNNAYGMFGIVTGGLIKNLNISNANISASGASGIIAAINYGTIANCKVTGSIRTAQTDDMILCGGIAGENYGTIQDSDSEVTINARGNSMAIGGISANNEGTVINCSSKGKIIAAGKNNESSGTIGGIVGFNSDGFIYECYSAVSISDKSQIAYVGGICGMSNGGEVYKTSSNANIDVKANTTLDATAYVGGIAGLSGNGLVMHSFSASPVNAEGTNVYVGGISGYNLNGYVQSCYTINSIKQKGTASIYAGGIVGMNEEGFVTENVAVNPDISDIGTVGRICGAAANGLISLNYAYDGIKCGMREFGDSELNGTALPMKDIRSKDLYFKPIGEGGTLEWSQDAWAYRNADNPYYPLPVLKDVKNQDKFVMPIY